MVHKKCRNSVFCVIFFVSYSVGTICGVLLMWYLSAAEGPWIRAYCTALVSSHAGLRRLAAPVRPLLLAWLCGLTASGHRLIPWLAGLRGCLMAYEAAACCVSGLSPRGLLLRGLVILPAFFALCRWAWLQTPQRNRSIVR